MKILYAVLLFLVLINLSFGQDDNTPNNKLSTKISGKIVDSETNKPLEAVTVQLYATKDSNKVVTGTATDKNGEFLIENFRPGNYELRISFIGYNTLKIRNILINKDEPVYAAGELKLSSGDEFTTNEIVVSAEKNLMEMGVDKKIFNVEKDINAQSGSVTDVLKNVPSVTVDSDGKISLRGSGNVRILINGKPSGLLSTDPSAVLEQIPANTVERIEIINNPTAKYDPEGMAGIINIVLKKSKTEQNKGYNYNLSVNAGTGDRYNLSTGLSYRLGKVNLYGNYGLRLFHMSMNGTSERVNFLEDTLHRLFSENANNAKMLGHLGTIGMDYDISKESYLGLSLSYSYRNRDRNENTDYRNFDINNLPSLFYKRNNFDGEEETGIDANLNYKQNFNKKFQVLESSVQFSSSNEDNTLNINQKNQDLNGNIYGNPYLENNYTKEKYLSLSVQADYTHPLKEDPVNTYKLLSKLEVGFKSTYRRTSDDFNVENFDTVNQVFYPNTLRSNDFTYGEQVHAIYGTYENNIKDFGYQIGLRLEETLTNSEQNTTNTKYDNNYFSYFPSLFLKQGIAKNLELQLSFTRRINRPRLGFLNPFIDYSDPQNLRQGNPDLKPEYINGIELGAVKYFTSFSLTSSVFYRITEDVITRYTTLDSVNNIFISSIANLNKAKSYGAELIATGSLFKWWYINGSASYFRTDLTGNINNAELNNSGYSWTGKLISNMSFPDLFDVQLSYYYQGRNVFSQGYMEPFQTLDVAFVKHFLNKRMSLGLRVSDIFNQQKYSFYQNTDYFNSQFTRKRDSRTAFLTFTYRIGTEDKKQKRQRPKQEDNNNDIEY